MCAEKRAADCPRCVTTGSAEGYFPGWLLRCGGILGYYSAVNGTNSHIFVASQARGIVMLIVGLSIAAFAGAMMKLLGDQISALQVAWFRFAGMCVIMLPYLLFRYGFSGLKPARPVIQLFRGLAMAGGTTTFVLGARSVDYADAIAVLYAYPFLLVIIAVAFLGERANRLVWVGVGGGFVGVLLVIRPQFDHINIGHLYIFACALIVSIQLALNRKLGHVSHPLVTAFAGAVCAALALTLVLPGSWEPIPDEAWLYIGLLVVAGSINQTLLVYAFAHADASTLAPFTYSEIVSAVIFGYLFFGTLPNLSSWLGILLITAGGLYVSRALQVKSVPIRVTRI
jgi:drug/metabolite transporter (DMT)-like permease